MQRKDKKGQLKIQEMSFMLLGLVLFFVIAGLFYLSISGAGLKKSQQELAEAKAISTVSSLSESPELSCGESLCVDTDKLIILKDNPAFSNYWDVDGLVVKKVYPYQNQTIECSSGNYVNCNTFTIKQPPATYIEPSSSSYVALCRKESKEGDIYDKCELGIISAYIER